MYIRLFILLVLLGLALNSQAARFKNNGNGTVLDFDTGLYWQRQDDGILRDWTSAGGYCDGLSLGGWSDWRRPGVKELTSIVDYRVNEPAIDEAMFPGTVSAPYWADIQSFGRAWRVDFDAGNFGTRPLFDNARVRCVR